jgi:hypothetical protein
MAMSPLPPDRKLRRLVAELAELPPEDLAAILGDMARPRRVRVEALITDYHGQGLAPIPAAPRPVAARAKPLRFARYSPWLAARLEAAVDASSQGSALSRLRRSPTELRADFKVTEAASALLRACAERLEAADPAEPVVPATGAVGWIASVGGALQRRGRPAS